MRYLRILHFKWYFKPQKIRYFDHRKYRSVQKVIIQVQNWRNVNICQISYLKYPNKISSYKKAFENNANLS